MNNSNFFPLLIVLLHIEAILGQCTVNMPTRADLESIFLAGASGQMKKKEPKNPSGSTTVEKQQSLFVSQKINCTGNLTEWIFAAKWYGRRDNFPELQVWRKQYEGYYMKTAYSSLSSISSQSSNNLYTFQPNPPLQVESGDLLGIHVPDKPSSSFNIYLYSMSVQNNYYYRKTNQPQDTFMSTMMGVKHDQHYFPMVSAVIVTPLPAQVTTVGPTTINAIPVVTSKVSTTHTSILSMRSSTHDTKTSSATADTSILNTRSSTHSLPTTTDTLDPSSQPTPLSTSSSTAFSIHSRATVTPSPSSTHTTSNSNLATSTLKYDTKVIHHTTSNTHLATSTLKYDTKVIYHTTSNDHLPTSTPINLKDDNKSITRLLIGVLIGVTVCMVAITGSAMGIVVLVLVVRRHKEIDQPQSGIAKQSTGIRRNRYIEKTATSPMYQGTTVKLTQNASLRNHLPQVEAQPSTAVPHSDSTYYDEAILPTVFADSSESVSVYPHVKVTSTSSYDTLHRAEATIPDNKTAETPVSPYEKPVLSETLSEYYTEDICVPDEQQRKEILPQNNDPEPESTVYKALYEAQHANCDLSNEETDNHTLDRHKFFKETPTYWRPQCTASAIYTQLASKRYREIPRQTIHIVEHLGSGQFATVSKAKWKTGGGEVLVAIKMLKKEASNEERIKFLQEAAINGQFHHLNIVKLLGVVTVGEPAIIVMELLRNGNLKKFLISHRPQKGAVAPNYYPDMFLNFCKQIASGMEYLSKKTFVHRDVAARNILVSDQFICKVADFGMSRDLEENTYYVSQGGLVPIKWTAPEALYYRKYSTASDVWSYGVVMFEIWSTGRKPFSSLTNEQYLEQVDEGYRLPPPPGCPRQMYDLMINCWHPKPCLRPSFTDVLQHLLQPKPLLLSHNVSEADMSLSPEATTLGASLKCGHHLFLDLQKKYVKD